ncbi:MAG: transglutaminase family protein [Thermodesulfobacteriota bacterium]
MEGRKDLYGRAWKGSFIIGILTMTLWGCSGLYFRHVPLEKAFAPAGVISNLGFREHWQGFFWYGEKIGFSHFRIEEARELPGAFKISSEAVIRFKMVGIKKETLLKEVDYVTPDLRLLRTSGEQKLDGKIRLVEAEVVDGGVRLKTEREGEWEERLIPVEGPIYPSLAQYLYPPLKGLDIGRQYRYQIFSLQSREVMEVNQRVLAFKRSDLFEGPAFEIKTRVSGINPKVWINMRGEMVFEMAGTLITAKEDESSAKRFIYESSLSKKDILLDYSVIKTDRVIPSPRELRELRLRLRGLEEPTLVISDERQRASIKREGDTPVVEFTVSIEKEGKGLALRLPISKREYARYLQPSYQIESRNREIIRRAEAILNGEKNSLLALTKLVHWVSDHLEDELVDSFSALDALHTKKGECQAHTYLYTALCRAVGIPTKVVSGLVYVEEVGFLYHAWAESFIGYWIPVDPTFDQIPADATHIKLVEGESFRDLSPLVEVIGRLQATIVDYKP